MAPKKGSIPWNKGMINTYSEESTRTHSESMKKRWEDPEYRKKQRKTRNSEEYKIKAKLMNFGEKNGNYGKSIHKNTMKSLVLTLDKIKERYPIFYSVEKPIEKEDNIYVKCKFCNELFIPDKIQLYERIRQIEHKNGNKKSFLYCCDDHKFKCPFSNRVSPESVTEYQKYYRKVLKETNKSIRNNRNNIYNIELRGKLHGYQLDHKYSIKQGFINNIDPKIIGHWKNLEVMFWLDNIQKKIRCSMELEELITEISR